MMEDDVYELITREVARQNEIHADGYPATRDGIRLGLASAEDELAEALKAWRKERRRIGWDKTKEELVQLAGVVVRTIEPLLAAEADRHMSEPGVVATSKPRIDKPVHRKQHRELRTITEQDFT